MNIIESLVKESLEFEPPEVKPRSEVIRDLPIPRPFNVYHIIVGMRRSGKTFYLFQKMRQLVEKGVDRSRVLYFNFSDDRLKPISAGLGAAVIEEYYRQVPSARERGAYLFLDEVQELDDWQSLLQRVGEHEKATMVVTGSSSRLSSEEIATQSRGRSHSHVMLPLSFLEYCSFAGEGVLARDVAGEGKAAGAVSPRDATRLSGLFSSYLDEGGFPGVQGCVPEDRIELLQGYVRDVVARDVAERSGRGDISLANQLALFALRDTGCELSLNGLSEQLSDLGYQAYWKKVNDLSHLFEQAYLYRLLPEFTMRLKPSTTAQQKVYAIDPGLVFAVSRASQQDVGKRFETAVYLEIVRQLAGRRIETVSSYTAPTAKREKVDFLVGDALSREPYELIQACVDMSAPKARSRELGSLGLAMRELGLDRGTVVTLSEEGTERVEGGTIDIVPAWRWSLSAHSN
jgi:predicted AAA+ superfamily ATPase